MGKGGGSAPAPTPPEKTGKADWGADVGSSGFAMQHGTPNQFGPAGSVTYDKYRLPDVDLGNGEMIPGGEGISNVYTSFNPEFQGIFDNLTSKGQTVVNNLPTQGFNPNIDAEQLRQSYIDEGLRNVRPVWEEEANSIITTMSDRGIPIGSDIWNGQMDKTLRSHSDYMEDLTSQAHQAAAADELRQFNQKLTQHNTGWNDFANYYNSIQGMLASLQGRDNPLIAASAPNVDMAGITRAYDDARTRQYMAQQGAMGAGLGGLFSGVGSVLGGLLSMSDERLKEDIEKVGSIGKGKDKLPVYRYRYKDDPSGKSYVGLMAQEVEDVAPEAVHEMADGHLAVDYDAAVAGSLGRHLREMKTGEA